MPGTKTSTVLSVGKEVPTKYWPTLKSKHIFPPPTTAMGHAPQRKALRFGGSPADMPISTIYKLHREFRLLIRLQQDYSVRFSNL